MQFGRRFGRFCRLKAVDWETQPNTLRSPWKMGARPDQEDPDRMAKVRSSLRSVYRTGRSRGIRVTDRDRNRIAIMGRWYSVKVDHLIRAEYDDAIWNPSHPAYGSDEQKDAARRAFHNIHHRLNQLRRIESDPARNVGPLVENDMNPDGLTAWFATRIGGRTAQLPWTFRNTINPNFAAHSWMAADIGMALESGGYRVLSERELSTGIDQHGERITAQLESRYVAPNGRAMNKKPDVAVLHPNGTDYIAIEVERDTNRAVSVYEQKLAAYAANSAVKAVWYVCASDTTARRVGQGAQKAFGGPGNFPLRITTIRNTDGYHFLDMNSLPKKFALDLEPMLDRTEKTA